jgi:hypothetical protein
MLALPMSPFLRYNPRLPRRSLDPREISVCTNAEVHDGSVVRTDGWLELVDLSTPSKIRHLAEHITNDGTHYLCAISTNNFYVYQPGSSWANLTRIVGEGGNYSGSDRWSSCSYGDWFIFTNGVDAMQKWDGNITHPATALSATPIRPQLVMTFGAHLICAADAADTDGAVGLKKFSWSAVGDPADFTSPTSGSAYAYEGSGGIQGIGPLTRDTIAVYKDNSVHLVEYVAAPMYFSFRSSLSGVGVYARDGFAPMGNAHVVLTNNGLRTYDGASLTPFGPEIEPMLSQYYPNDNAEFAQVVNDTYNNKLWIFLPSSGDDWHFTSAFMYSMKDQSWSYQTGFDSYSICLLRMGTETDTFRLIFSDMLTHLYKQDPAATTRHGVAYTSTVETAMVCPGLLLYQATTTNTELVQIDVGTDSGAPHVYVGVSNGGDHDITWHGPYTPNAAGQVFTTVVGRWFTFRITDDTNFSVHTLTPWFVQRGVV